jgi:hypothetical protein
MGGIKDAGTILGGLKGLGHEIRILLKWHGLIGLG